jgi:hypothetical protein
MTRTRPAAGTSAAQPEDWGQHQQNDLCRSSRSRISESARKSLLTRRRNGGPGQSRRIAKTISVVTCLRLFEPAPRANRHGIDCQARPARALTQERDGGRETRDYSTVDVVIRLGLIGLLINWSLPFVTVALWSAILVVALYPIFDWLSRSLRSLRLAASLITLLCLAVVIGPVTLGWGLLSSAAPSS